MNINSENLLESILESLSRIDYIHAEEIPNIDLYMDQVTTLMDSGLSSSKRYEEDKILTKTMINNYAKNNLLPPPDKKKYSREHILILTFIYYFKNILAIKDIETLLNPLTETYFQTENQPSLSEIYEEDLLYGKKPGSRISAKRFPPLLQGLKNLSLMLRKKTGIIYRCFPLSAV